MMTEDQIAKILKVVEMADAFVWSDIADEDNDTLAEMEHEEYRGDECDGALADMMFHILKIKRGVTHEKDADRVYPDGDGGWIRPGA